LPTRNATIEGISLRADKKQTASLELEAPAAQSPDAQLSVPVLHLPTPKAIG